MKIEDFLLDPPNMDFGPVDHKLPLIMLRERRRELVLALADQRQPVSMQQLRDIATIQQAIKAIETVIAE